MATRTPLVIGADGRPQQLQAGDILAGGSGGSGTVTTVSVVTVSGVSGSVANPTTTPAITITLGNITPSQIVCSGTIAGTNLSGTNTGDQVITLTGAVTGSGSGSFVTTISAGAVTNAMLAGSIAASKLVGSDITTVGTITIGVWNGTAIAAAYLPALNAITAPTADVSINTHKLTNVVDPTLAQDAATKNYVDSRYTAGAGITLASFVFSIGGGAITNAMLSGSIASSKLIGSDIATVGVVTVGTWQATLIAAAYLPSLDAITLAAGNVNINSHRITNVTDPVSAQDAATKNYVDAATLGIDVKASCRAATTANITLSGTQTVDGVVLNTGDRVLVKAQSTGANNGIYLVSAGAWARTMDANLSSEVTSGMFTFITEGTVNAGTGWLLTTADPITLNTTALTFTQFSGAGTYSAGSGLTLTGTAFSISAGAITNAMLAGSIAASKLIGTDIVLTESQITSLTSDLALKAPLASPSFTGTVVTNSYYGALTTNADGATVTFDAGVSNKHTVTLGGNRILAVTNDHDGQTLVVILTQDATGSRTVTWWSGIKWSGGTVPVLTTTAGKADVFTFIRTSSGNYLGFSTLNF